MPIEIRELVIKATVLPDGAVGTSSQGAANGAASSDELIQQCIDKVLEILKEKNER